MGRQRAAQAGAMGYGVGRWGGLAALYAIGLCACGSDDSTEPAPVAPACADGTELGPDGRCYEQVDLTCPDGTELDGERCSPPGCAAGSWVHEGQCVPAGPPSSAECPPGELVHRGVCVPAGVPPDACFEGFVPNDGGCDPVLPDETCPPGLMALPGDTECRPVGDCGEGTYGNIPALPNTQYVDASFQGDSDGSVTAPWTTILDGLASAEPGAIVAVAAGTYERFTWVSEKPTRIWGRCPEMVAIVGPDGSYGLQIQGTPSQSMPPSELRGLTVRGGLSYAVVLNWIDQLVLEDVIIRDATDGAVNAGAAGAADVVARNVLVEDTKGAGLESLGSDLTLEGVHLKRYGTSAAIAVQTIVEPPGRLDATRVVVEQGGCAGVFCSACEGRIRQSVMRDLRAGQIGRTTCPGSGVSVGPVLAVGATEQFSIENVTIDRAKGGGVHVEGGNVEIRHATIRDTTPDVEHAGHGLHIHPIDSAFPPNVVLQGSLIDGSIANGVYASDASVLIEGALIRNTQANVSGPNVGRLGIGLQARDGSDVLDADVTIRGSRIENSSYGGLVSFGSAFDASGLVIENTSDDVGGLGVGLFATTYLNSQGEPISVRLVNSQIVGSTGVGMLLAGVRAEVEGVSVVDTSLSQASPASSSGLMIQTAADGVSSDVDLVGVAVELSHDVGVAVFDSAVRASGSRIVDVRPNAHGRFGDGVLASSTVSSTFLSLDGVAIRASERAAVANFGATVEYGDSTFECHAFDLNGESGPDSDFSFVDLGGNACGCPPTNTCKVVSAELEPPSPVVPPPP